MRKIRPAMLLLVLIGSVSLTGCGSSSPADFAPLKKDLDAGLEVWEVQITSQGGDGEASEADNKITRYIVLDNGKVVRQYICNNSGGNNSWKEPTARDNVTIKWGKESDGSISVDQTTSISALGDTHLTFTIKDGAIKGEISTKRITLVDISGTAKKISP